MMRCRHYALMLPRSPILTASRFCFWLAGLSLLALLAPALAGAECVLDGTTVTCDGSDPDGFDAAGVDDLTVNVLPDATVDNGGGDGVPALNLANGNTVNVQAGVVGETEITASGAGSHGISALDDNTITNAGSITVTGDNSIGIQVADDNGILNFGSVTASGSGGVGIEAGDGYTIINEEGATITADGANGIGVRLNATTNAPNGFTNFGSVTASGSGGVGIEAGDAYNIINRGTITADGPNGIGVRLNATTNAPNEFANYGIITSTSDTGAAVSLELSGPNAVNLVTNRVDALIDGSASGVAIRGSEGVDNVRNRGAIVGDVELAGGDDVFGFSTNGVIFDGQVSGGDGRDTLRLLGGTINGLRLPFFREFEVLDVQDGGSWVVTGSSDSFLEETTVREGRLLLNGTVNLSGTYLQGTGTVLQLGLNADGTNDQLVVDGDVTVEEGAILWAGANELLVDDATYTFLTSTSGTISRLFDEENFPDDLGSLSFTQVMIGNSLAIEFSRVGYASPAATANQRATGIHLDEILAATPTGDMATVLTSLDTLSRSELQAALDALHPEVYDAQANAMLSFGRSVAELAAFRRPRCEEVVYERRPQIVAPSPCSRGWMPWGSAFGLFAKRDGGRGHIDFSHGGGGLLLGADHPLGDHFMLYGFFGGGYAGVDVDEAGKGHLFGGALGAGARWSLGGTRIHGLVGYARGWHKQERKIDFGQNIYRISRTAKANYDSNLILALVKAGHTFRFGSLDLEPLATAEYGYLMEESFGESGAGDINLEVDKRSNSVLSTSVGARLAYTFFKWEYIEDWLEWADGVWTPELSARWRGNWIGRERDLDARLVGAPAGVGGFTVEGQDAKQGFQVGAGVAFRPLRRLMSIRVDYDGFYGDGSTIHRIGASIRFPLGGSAG